jgi:hypothetical protein
MLLFALVGAGGAVAALLAAWPFLRRPTRRAAAITSDREDLADALARLTLAYEAGEISDSAYRDRRLRLKAQMLDSEFRSSEPRAANGGAGNEKPE